MSQQPPAGPQNEPMPQPSQPGMQASPEQIRAIKARNGRNNMIGGCVIAIIGAVITVGTLALAGEGGTYIIAWGAIIFGGIQFVVGLVNWLRNQ